MVQARRLIVAALLAVACVVTAPVPSGQALQLDLPASLTDAQFWKLSTDLSEPGGYFRSENLVSNEHTFQYVIPDLVKQVPSGGVYLGVAPDQNFTYMAALKPRMAFILDIRRGNLLQHLMYKALFELSVDRAEFVSRLFSKPRPAGLTAATPVFALFSAYARVNTSETLYKRNAAAIKDHLIKKSGFPLSEDDWDQLEAIYFSFFWEGPDVRYTASGGGFGRGSSINNRFPSYGELMVQTDFDGKPRSYLASEENFRIVKALEEKNLIVPVVGNFAGGKALRAIGRYSRERGAAVTAFYVSNVEQYLYQDNLFDAFAKNVASLPTNGRSSFIRSVSARFGYGGSKTWTDGRATALYPIQSFVRDFELGLLGSYFDLNARSR